MARKRATPTPTDTARDQRAADASSKIRMPQTWRVVTSRKLRSRKGDDGDATAREVPEIRIGGEWLDRVGFPKGRRYLVSADRSFETIYLQAEQNPALRTRSRRRV